MDSLEMIRQAVNVRSDPDPGDDATAKLRARLDELQAEVERTQWRLNVIEKHEPVGATVAERIEHFLRLYAGKNFSPRELMAALGAGEESVRKALTWLVRDGFLVRAAYATYTVDPHNGPPDAASARLLRNWEDP